MFPRSLFLYSMCFMIYINKIFFINKKNFIWYMKDNTHSQFSYQQCIYLPYWYQRVKIPALLKYYTGKAKNEEKKKHKNRNTDHVGASKKLYVIIGVRNFIRNTRWVRSSCMFDFLYQLIECTRSSNESRTQWREAGRSPPPLPLILEFCSFYLMLSLFFLNDFFLPFL